MPVTCGRRSRLRARTDGRGALGQIDDAAGNADVDQQVAETTQVGRTPGFERVDYGIGDHHEAHVRTDAARWSWCAAQASTISVGSLQAIATSAPAAV